DSCFCQRAGNGPITRGAKGLGSSLNAILFKSGTLQATQTWTGPQLMKLSSTFTALVPLITQAQQPLVLKLPKPSKVMVTFSALNVRIVPGWPQSADVAIFVN